MNTLYLGDCLNVLRDSVADEYHFQSGTAHGKEKRESGNAGVVDQLPTIVFSLVIQV